MADDLTKKRYDLLDTIRGITLVSMICFHTRWDLIHLFGRESLLSPMASFLWQQSICWSFILLSGFCWSLGKKRIRRGVIVLGGGLLVTLSTFVAFPDQPVLFGVLHMLGVSMLLLTLMEPLMKKVMPIVGLFLSFFLFYCFYNVSAGYFNLGVFGKISLPAAFYKNNGTACLGFPGTDFYSSDYFPMLPWFFLFLCGYFFFRFVEGKEGFWQKLKGKIKGFDFLGKHSLIIYLLHQPVVYGLLMVWDFVGLG
ncbi:MAG: heparan-alpha-glucosaminide N-acetyltransferase domain-containing protein [Lachnospiraceae bacterium]|nr:heparan-alpha-glucosaminide N-acetyltransferase domain-containing protein [Lachnospiraceae bacterium]